MIPFSFLLPLFSDWQRIAIYAGLAIALFVAGNIRGCVNEREAFVQYRATIEAQAEAQKQKNEAEIKRRDEIGKERYAALEIRYRSLNDKYGRLRSSASAMPAVPETTRPVDDASRDQRLLDVLQYAEKQTAQLIELQEWVKQQQKVD